MARSKVKLAWIANDASRRSTLRKRCKGLTKKVSEISTLCGVEASMVLYTAPDREPEVWPSLDEAKRLFTDFRRMPDLEQNRKTMDQETFLNQKVAKLQEQLRKEESEVREMDVLATLFDGLLGDDFSQLVIEKAAIVAWTLEKKLNQVYNRMAEFGAVVGNGNAFMINNNNMNNLLGQTAAAPPMLSAGNFMMDMNMMIPMPMPMPLSIPITIPIPMPMPPCVEYPNAQEMMQRQNWMMYTNGVEGDQQLTDVSSSAWNYFDG